MLSPFLSNSPVPRAQSESPSRVTGTGPAAEHAKGAEGAGREGPGLAGIWMEALPRPRRQMPDPRKPQRTKGRSRPARREAPAPGEGGAGAQVGRVGSLSPGVSGTAGSDCLLAGTGRGKQTLGPRIQFWEAGFGSQTLPQRRAMEVEGVRNFKELRAKFQNKLEVPPPPGPTKFPADVSHKDYIGTAQSTQVLANGKPRSSDQNQSLPNCSSDEPQPLKPQKMMLVQSSENLKCSNSPGPLGGSVDAAVNSQKDSLPLDVNPSNAEIIDQEKVMETNSFRDKLWNWEKFSSQKSEMSPATLLANGGSRAFCGKNQKYMGVTLEKPRIKLETNSVQTFPSKRHLMAQRKSLASSKDSSFLVFQPDRKSSENPSPGRSSPESPCQPTYRCELGSHVLEKQQDVRHHQLPKIKPLPPIVSLGPPPPKPPKPPVVSLEALRGKAAAIPKTHREAAVEEGVLPPKSAEFEEPHNYEATISYLRHSGNSIDLCTAKDIADSIYEVRIEELQKPCKSFLHQEFSSKHEGEDEKGKEKEPHELEPQKPQQDLHLNHLSKVGACDGIPGKTHKMRVHRDRRSMLPGKQEAEIADIQTKACPEGSKLTRYSQGHCGHVEALQATKDTPVQEASKQSLPAEIYDDVESPKREGPKSDFSYLFASDSEGNSEEMYDDVYKTKSNYPKIDLDGKETLKRLRRFLKKETDRFKIKRDKSKANLRT
ncbi:FYN-binding protein 2 isoform X2 [Tamandua tetradactyla]|uniref:FYN-binding protein 2 isoform X2 n=1 Tax=Tamandua tetradactyla TaxID=48850 RepID=UPI004053BF73